MPKIGMRMIKTAVAVFLCFLVGMLRSDGIPFYSAIAAVLCMQSEIEDSKEKAKSRIIATIIGGVAGLLFLNMERYYIAMPIEWIRYLVISIIVIVLIYFTVAIKQPSTAYLSCVVFMSVAVSHVNDSNVSAFALNRILDTLIGILISLGINQIHLPFLKKKEDIIVLNFDQVLSLYKTNSFKFKKYFQKDPNIVLTSSKTPATLLEDLSDLKVKLPIVVMDGAAIYDNQTKKYHHIEHFDEHSITQVRKILDSKTTNYFCYEINAGHLIIHLSNLTNEIARLIYDKTKHLQYKHYFHHRSPNYQTEQPVTEIFIVDTREIIIDIQKQLEEIKVVTRYHQDARFNDVSFLKIYPQGTSIEKQIQNIQEEHKLKDKEVYILDDVVTSFKELDAFFHTNQKK